MQTTKDFLKAVMVDDLKGKLGSDNTFPGYVIE